MRLSEKQADFFDMVWELRDMVQPFLEASKVYIKVDSWTRTPIEQKLLFENGRTNSINSMHLSGLAVDLLIYRDGEPLGEDCPIYQFMGEHWEKIGGRWGGRWKVPSGERDVYHFEYCYKKRRAYGQENKDS